VVIPLPKWIEQAEPGGVKWTIRNASPFTKSASSRQPRLHKSASHGRRLTPGSPQLPVSSRRSCQPPWFAIGRPIARPRFGREGGSAGPAAAGTRPPSYVPKAHVLTNVEFDKLREHPEKLLIIDLRRPDELSSRGGFPIYLNIQIDQLEQSLAWIRAIATS
jgi:hypothetical protein